MIQLNFCLQSFDPDFNETQIITVWLVRSVDCFRLGWPMRADADFFKTPKDAYPNLLNGVGSQ